MIVRFNFVLHTPNVAEIVKSMAELPLKVYITLGTLLFLCSDCGHVRGVLLILKGICGMKIDFYYTNACS